MKSKDRIYKLVIIGLFLIFGTIAFFSIKFLKDEISNATKTPADIDSSQGLDIDAWDKIKYRFIQ